MNSHDQLSFSDVARVLNVEIGKAFTAQSATPARETLCKTVELLLILGVENSPSMLQAQQYVMQN